MEIEEEAMDYMDVNPLVLMLREEGAYWESPAIMEEIKTIELVTFAKKIKTAKPITPTKNIVFVPIESISASVSIPVKFVCDSFPI